MTMCNLIDRQVAIPGNCKLDCLYSY